MDSCSGVLLETLAGGGLVLVDGPDDVVVAECTGGAAAALGLPMEEVTGRALREILAAEPYEALQDALRSARESGVPRSFACPLPSVEEDARHADCRVVALDDGRVVVALLEDERALAELRETEERYALSVAGANDGLWDWNLTTGDVFFSPRWKAILGYDEDEIRNEFGEWEQLVHPEDLPAAQEAIQRYLAGTDSHLEIEFRMAHKMGDHRWILARATSVRDAEGRPTRMCGSHTDITERKELESELRERVSFLEQLASTTVDAIVTMDDEGRVVFWNQAAERIFGFAREEIVGSPLHEKLAPPEMRRRFEAAYDRFKETGQGAAVGQVIELTALRADGTRLPVELSLAALPMRGAWWGLGFARDISERKAQERALHDEKRRTEAILGSVHAGIVIIDPNVHRIVEANDVAAKLLGLPAPVLKNMPCRQFICPPQDEKCPWENAGSPILGRETVIRNSAGEEIPVLKSVVPFLHGGRRFVVESMVDIRPQKRTQAELQTALATAEAATRAKSEFVANMSHEIRTPMNAIIGMTNLTLDSELTADQRENLEIVQRSSEALLSLINDILDFSKIDAGRLVIEEVDFDLRELVENAADVLAMRAEEKGLELVSIVSSEVPRGVRGDPNRLRQVLLNLLGNAVKFTERGEVVLRVAPGGAPRARDVLRFEVLDTGIGIDADKQEEIFESFSQADGSTSRRFGGTGLGLAISRRLVELMGGDIQVESKPGEGSCFSFDVPLVPARHTAPVASPRPRDISGKRVLVSDDNKTNRTLLDKLLTGWGCEPILTEGGAEALALLRREDEEGRHFDILLLDHMMPGLTGVAAAKNLSEEMGERRPPVLLLSSIGSRPSGEELRAAGIDGYLTKPLKATHVFAAIAELVSGGKDALPPGAVVTADSLASRAFEGVSVLLVEDQPFNQKVATKLLRRRGVRVSVAGNGEEAVRAATEARHDAIIMDVQMPVMDGLEATRRIRAWEAEAAERARVPIIAMTAHAMAGDRERCLQAGMDDYLTKPLRTESLFEPLDRWTRAPEEDDGQTASPALLPEAHGEPPAVPLDGVRERFGDDPPFLAELLDLFAEQIREQLVAMRSALAAGDTEALRRGAHATKGSANNFGLEALGDRFAVLERRIAAGDLVGAEALVDEAAALVEPTLEALGELVKELSS